ncbi:MAG: tRNA (N6-isopentenyl adenosine(37)-C2)-methylthiotransferase MiaB [Planctomycetota bacterium]
MTPTRELNEHPLALLNRGRKVCLEVFGCQMNKLDGELILGQFQQAGYEVTEDRDQADVFLVHTCSVREHAEDRVLGRLGAMKRQKQHNPDLVLGVVGCMAQRDQDLIAKRLPHVDIICGTREFPKLPFLVSDVRESGNPVVAVSSDEDVVVDNTIRVRSNPFQAFVTVVRGCNKRCAFCIVPKVRGPEVSRPQAEIVDEVKSLVDQGTIEVTLLGQTVNHYGSDLDDGSNLVSLIRELHAIQDLKRIRFITSYPRSFPDDLIRCMGELDKVTHHLHMPLQHGSDRILKKMRRGYTVAQYMDRVEAVKRLAPQVEIASDFIVGYCTETDEDFEATCRSIPEIEFMNSYIFKYSVRPDTPSAGFDDDVPEPIKKERNQRLLEIQKEVSLKVNRRYLGQTLEVLAEGVTKHDVNRWMGRARTQHIVTFQKGVVLAGEMVQVRIDDCTPLALYGTIVGRS